MVLDPMHPVNRRAFRSPRPSCLLLGSRELGDSHSEAFAMTFRGLENSDFRWSGGYTWPPMPLPPDTSARRAEDLELVRLVIRGDRSARRTFGKRVECIPRYLAAANSRFGSPLTRDDLADLAQDTLLIVWRKLDVFEGRATLESWIWRFCQLELSNLTRKRFRRRVVTDSTLVEVNEGEPVEPETPLVEYDHLERSLQALGPPEEEVIRLKHFEHLMFAEIAERLELSPNTAKTRYYRGMAWLKRHLESEGLGEEN